MNAAAASLCPQCAVTCHVYPLNRVSLMTARSVTAETFRLYLMQ